MLGEAGALARELEPPSEEDVADALLKPNPELPQVRRASGARCAPSGSSSAVSGGAHTLCLLQRYATCIPCCTAAQTGRRGCADPSLCISCGQVT